MADAAKDGSICPACSNDSGFDAETCALDDDPRPVECRSCGVRIWAHYESDDGGGYWAFEKYEPV